MQKVLTNKEQTLLEHLFKMKEDKLLANLDVFLRRYYDKVYTTNEFIYAVGEQPVALLAHLDTVFAHPPKNIYYDERKGVMWSPEGLGADDRAGVFAIMKIIQSGYRPSIIFTTGEESGGIGARIFVNKFATPASDLNYLIQLDRRGAVDAVFYNCANDEFTKYVESYGFIENWGTFTDISTICPRWKIAGVNLSIGYEDEHSTSETFHINHFFATVDKVKNMIDDCGELDKPFEYIYDYSLYDPKSWWSMSEWMMCDSCKQGFLEHEIFPTKTKEGKIIFLCPDCLVEKANWCNVCGEPFLTYGEKSKVCHQCAKEGKGNHAKLC